MVGQVERMLRRFARGEISSRGERRHRGPEQPPCDQVRIRQVPDSDHRIDPFGNKVDESVGDIDMQADIGAGVHDLTCRHVNRRQRVVVHFINRERAERPE